MYNDSGREDMTKQKKQYSNKKASQFNWWRSFWQFVVCKIGYLTYLKVVYRIEVHGLENVPKDNKYIVCPNHLSSLDPPMIAAIMPRSVAFMAKKELFNIPFLRWWLDWMGAFAVDRENLSPSTVKTAENIKDSRWVLGIFPQGTRCAPGEINEINKGFAGLARLTKCDILPVGIIGSHEKHKKPLSGKIIINIGKIIPYNRDLEVVKKKWIEEIQNLTGFKYVEKKHELVKANGGSNE